MIPFIISIWDSDWKVKHRERNIRYSDRHPLNEIPKYNPLSSYSFFSHFICHLQGFGTYYYIYQPIISLQIPLADGLQIKYLQGYPDVEFSLISTCKTDK